MPTPEETKRTIRGTAPAPAAPAARYTVKNPSPEAAAYYQNVVPTMQRLIGQKHDETYLDEKGNQCTANSCLSFANTVQEQALGQGRGQRGKAQLYNPEFTRTAEQQGWVPIDLKDAKQGDRLQAWDTPYPGSDQTQRIADLGGRELIRGKYPSHMMVLGAPLEQYGGGGQYVARVYNDGHQYEAANRQTRTGVDGNGYVAYRYIGKQGQPTNDPAQAVAPNPAAAAPRVIRGTTASR